MQQSNLSVELEQSLGWYSRLHDELASALEQRPSNPGKIDRLVDDLVSVERVIADLRPVDEQCGERLFA